MKKLFTLTACVIMLFSFSTAQSSSKEDKKKAAAEQKLAKEEKKKADAAEKQAKKGKGKSSKKDNNSSSAITGKISKEEASRIKEELKGYMKNPEAYKAKMEANQAALDSNDVQIKQLTQDLASANSKQAELENKLSETDAQLKSAQEEKGEMTMKTEESSTASNNAPTNAPSKGIIYKVQLGIYKTLNINKYFDQQRLIGYEEVDGMNRYIISYFADEDVAQNFVKDIRKLGIKDAFVAKYIDGTRVYEWSENPKYKGKKVPETLEEAIEINKAPQKAPKAAKK